MKKAIIAILAVFLVAVFTSCSYTYTTAVKGTMEGDWEVLVTGTDDYTALYRYVDKEYGVIIYCGDNFRITSQKLTPTVK